MIKKGKGGKNTMHVPYSELKRGTFLIASPSIDKGIFFRCVILLCDHTSLGSFGLVINKPLEVTLEQDLSQAIQCPNNSIHMRRGGPNQPNQAILLQNFAINEEISIEICEGIYLNMDANTIQTEMKDRAKPQHSIFYFGHGEWNRGILEREFLNNIWFLHPATSDHLFEIPIEFLWQTLLREMGGKYKILSMLPENLNLN